MGEIAASEEMKEYFRTLSRKNKECYTIAEAARSVGKDPETFVEIPQAEDLASRVEKLLKDYGVDGVAEDIRRLTKIHGNREIVALMIAGEIAGRPGESLEKVVDRAIRVGLAVLTEGILVAPLEGIADTKIKTNADGSSYIDLIFAGPIRAAGGTGQAMSVLIADMVRQALKIGRYIPTKEEIARFNEEIPLYKQQQHLQFSPTPQEIDLIVRNCPICIDGEGTETVEISGYRDLPRIETNRVRGGACLVIAEGMCQKAAKLKKHVDKLQIKGWEFIGEYVDAHKPAQTDESARKTVQQSFTYLKDLVAGRPIFGHPCAVGGFRLRYGRARTTGLAALAFNPASMYAMDEFMALGTQIKIERPGKACVATPCDLLDGPYVLLKNGDLIHCQTKEEIIAVSKEVAEVVDNGEILVPFGEFSENNHPLVPCGYSPEWHKATIMSKTELPKDWESPTYERAKEMCKQFDVPLHPKFNMFWYDVPVKMLVLLRSKILSEGRFENNLVIPKEPDTKRILENLCATHCVRGEEVVIDELYSMPLIDGLGLCVKDGRLSSLMELEGDDSLSAVSKAAGFEIRAKARTRIGTRMARPEKAKEREMSPKVHSLFPVGRDGQYGRDIDSAIKASKSKTPHLNSNAEPTLSIEVGKRMCPMCGNITFRTWCRKCKIHTLPSNAKKTYGNSGQSTLNINLSDEYREALLSLKESQPDELKCVEGLISRTKTPEIIEKGILRAKNDVSVYKDGTIRYDMTDVPLTHFRPREIGLSVEKANELGYSRDWNGDPLTSVDQICELKVQDIIPSKDCGDFLVKVSKYIDDELEKIYGMKRYYNISKREGLIGHLTFGLAPHTSGCILCRIIGYSDIRGCYGHPFFHAAKRRNCDGDEDCVILALDGLLNFSRLFLPDRRGGLMDAPLVLTTRLDPNEIDKEAHNIDCLRAYPLEFFNAAMEMRDPKELEKIMDLVGGRIGTEKQYQGLGFTHDTSDISEGPKNSAYTTLESMTDKMDAQLYLGKKIRAVDERDVATKVINKHFLPDMAGNLRSFSTQTVRCTKCGDKYRRIPLSGICKCGNQLTLTVHEASVKKYLEVSKEISDKYELDDYTKERIMILEMSMDSVFNNDKIKKCRLSDFY
ncbi:DNA polymerase II large subunit [Candidatus Methanoplasma termitum]|uniref:DNA polymerase II large subunit n=1 Tax=Candidatus Methanoplasma termitum TaxID=1577791 RepID=A0A0A7LEX4_9ARCH|nr:DNA polymerase II large subunit [Candidatus Methanoplasma termitum]AIZ56061.1 DNA polymerase II large subunit [Candidatus Methanoplasma termitum]